MVSSMGFDSGNVSGMTVDGVAAGAALDGFAGQVGALSKDNPLQVVLAYLLAQLPALTSASGDTSAVLHSAVALDAVATLATATISGGSYAGPLAGFAGTSVAPSPVSYDSNGDPVASITDTAWVLDFNGVRKIDRLFVTDSPLTIALVLPWMGTEWGGKSLFPLSAPGFNAFAQPTPDASPVSDAAFPETETAKVLVQFATATTEAEVLEHLNLRSKTRPSNVRVSVGGRPPFFVHPEVLTGPVPLADFAGEVNAYLDAVRATGASGAVPVVLELSTDAPGVLSLDTPVLQLDRTAPGSFGAASARSFEFPVQGEQLAELEFPATSAAAWHIKRLSFTLREDLQRWQAFPRDVTQVDHRRRARVLPDLNLAQSFQMQISVPLAGVALHLAAESPAELLLELRADEAGLPGSEPLATQPFSVPATGEPGWQFVELAAPVSVDAGRTHWWVLKASTGVVAWSLEPAEEDGPLRFDRDGAGWRRLPGAGAQLSAVYRLLRGAAVDESPHAFEIDIGEAVGPPRVTVADGGVVLDFSTGDDVAPSNLSVIPQQDRIRLQLRLRAHARGDLTLSDAEAQYEPAADE